MKKLLQFLFLTAPLTLAACGTISSATGAIQTPAQLVSEVCPTIHSTVVVMTPAKAELSPSALTVLARMQVADTTLCTGAAAVNLATLNSLPALLDLMVPVINSSSMSQQAKLDATLAIGVAKMDLQQIAQQTPTPALPSSTVVAVTK